MRTCGQKIVSSRLDLKTIKAYLHKKEKKKRRKKTVSVSEKGAVIFPKESCRISTFLFSVSAVSVISPQLKGALRSLVTDAEARGKVCVHVFILMRVFIQRYF